MADADGYVRGETLDVFFDMLDENTLEDLFDKEMDNIIIENSTELKCTSCEKVCKSKGGLSRHMKAKHDITTSKKVLAELQLEQETVKTLLMETKTTLSSNKCFPAEIRDKIGHYSANISDDLLSTVNKIYNDLLNKNDGEKFYSSFYSIVVMNASRYLSPLQSPASTLLAQKLADKIFYHYKQQIEKTVDNVVTPITEKEMGGLQYLAGYVVNKIKKKSLSGKDYNSVLNQSKVKILNHAIVDEIHDQKLIETLNRGGLTAVKTPFQKIFLKTEEQFRRATQKGTHSSKINIYSIKNSLIEDTEVLSHYNSIVDTSGVQSFDDEEQEKLLSDMLNLYLRVRSFSLAKDVVSKHKIDSHKKRTKALRTEIKKSTEKPQINE